MKEKCGEYGNIYLSHSVPKTNSSTPKLVRRSKQLEAPITSHAHNDTGKVTSFSIQVTFILAYIKYYNF